MSVEIIVASITAAGLLGSAFVAGMFKIRELRLSLEQTTTTLNHAKREMDFQKDGLDVTGFIKDWDSFVADVRHLMSETGVDRFVLLRAWNGEFSPEWTTAICQIHKDNRPIISYIHTGLDEDYVDRLRSATVSGPVVFTIDDLQTGTLTESICRTEEIEEAMWAHIITQSIPGSDSKGIIYCSFGSHSRDVFDVKTVMLSNLIVGRLKGVVNNYPGVAL